MGCTADGHAGLQRWQAKKPCGLAGRWHALARSVRCAVRCARGSAARAMLRRQAAQGGAGQRETDFVMVASAMENGPHRCELG
jgi:hypothetical protein